MHLIIDVDYRISASSDIDTEGHSPEPKEYAVVAGIVFADWQSDRRIATHTVTVEKVAPYQPGQFYKRELPCLLALIETVTPRPTTIVIDGYVTLGQTQRDGLGAYLYRTLGECIPVIGIAKNRFADTPEACEVYRGQSQKPVYVTCMGMTLEEAKERVQTMHGQYRFPTLAKAVDSECRQASPTDMP